MFLREKALAPGGPVSVAALTDDASLLDAGAGLYLTHLGDLKNVNALAHSQRIVFNAKLTIVFGENACGKTGYVRVLKKAAAVRTSETILPDVSQGKHTGGSPCARIGYKLGPGDEQVVDWQDEAGLAPLNRIDVFDARGLAACRRRSELHLHARRARAVSFGPARRRGRAHPPGERGQRQDANRQSLPGAV
jgi:hypothetical protein